MACIDRAGLHTSVQSQLEKVLVAVGAFRDLDDLAPRLPLPCRSDTMCCLASMAICLLIQLSDRTVKLINGLVNVKREEKNDQDSHLYITV